MPTLPTPIFAPSHPLDLEPIQQVAQEATVLTEVTENLAELESLSKRDRVYNLTLELRDWKDRKKRANKDFNEEIKRIQAEIDSITDEDIEEI